jgi:hypothetical protein
MNVMSIRLLLGWHLGTDRLNFLEHAFDLRTEILVLFLWLHIPARAREEDSRATAADLFVSLSGEDVVITVAGWPCNKVYPMAMMPRADAGTSSPSPAGQDTVFGGCSLSTALHRRVPRQKMLNAK